jgi:hypothetical protein
VAACSKGGRVEVDGGSAIMTKSSRKRTAPTRSEVEAAACFGWGMRWWRALGPGSRMAGGGSDTVVSRVTTERERAQGQKFPKCGETEGGPKILV